MAIPLPFPAPSEKSNKTLEQQIEFHTARLDENLYIADYYAASTELLLDALSITHVLTVAANTAPLFPQRLQYHVIEVFDENAQRIIDHFDAALDWMQRAVAADPARARILVHCHAGRSRSATVCCAFLMRKHRWSAHRAVEFVKEKRDSVEPNDGFLAQLRCFEEMGYRVDRNSLAYRKLCIELFGDFASSSTPVSMLSTPHPVSSVPGAPHFASFGSDIVNRPAGPDDDPPHTLIQGLALNKSSEPSSPRKASVVPTLNLPPRRRRSTTLDSQPTAPKAGLLSGMGAAANAAGAAAMGGGAPPGANKSALRCRKCRRFICAAEEMSAPHQADPAAEVCGSFFFDPPPLWLEQAIKRPPGSGSGSRSTSMSAMADVAEEPPRADEAPADPPREGKIMCPNAKCDAKLGQWAWSGVQCSCGRWVTPGFAINASKVDIER